MNNQVSIKKIIDTAYRFIVDFVLILNIYSFISIKAPLESLLRDLSRDLSENLIIQKIIKIESFFS